MTADLMLNPRYANYCRVHDEASKDEMMMRDCQRWPGGHMAGFILWIHARWREWDRMTGKPLHYIKTQEDHDQFDAWLATYIHPCDGACH